MALTARHFLELTRMLGLTPFNTSDVNLAKVTFSESLASELTELTADELASLAGKATAADADPDLVLSAFKDFVFKNGRIKFGKGYSNNRLKHTDFSPTAGKKPVNQTRKDKPMADKTDTTPKTKAPSSKKLATAKLTLTGAEGTEHNGNYRKASTAGYSTMQTIVDNPGITGAEVVEKGGRIADIQWDIKNPQPDVFELTVEMAAEEPTAKKEAEPASA